jgi:ABC-2 type transport system ATP-binding protein/lipopolysaccharide transport system ATP-binding protein
MDMHDSARQDAIPETPEPVIELTGVSVRYRLPKEKITSLKEFAIRTAQRRISYHDFWALEDVTMSVYPGEVVGIIGANGAGKSTLLKTVARVLRPTKGRVIVRGRVAPLLELGAGFDYELTGRENIFLNGALLGFSRSQMAQRFDAIVAFAELEDFIDAPLRTYSTGMVARLGFAIATDIEPEVLIVDEVLAVGDERFQQKCRNRMKGFREAGITTLLVSHNAYAIKTQCDRAVWLEHGHLRAIGPAVGVLRQYKGLEESEALTGTSETGEDVAIDAGLAFEVSRAVEDTEIPPQTSEEAPVASEPAPEGLAEPAPLVEEPVIEMAPEPAAPPPEDEVLESVTAAQAAPQEEPEPEPVPEEPPPPPPKTLHTVTLGDSFFGIWLWKYLELHSSAKVPIPLLPGESFSPDPDAPLSYRHAAALLCSAAGWLPPAPSEGPNSQGEPDTFALHLAKHGVSLTDGPGNSLDGPLARADFAILLCETKGWEPIDPPAGRFHDVPVTSARAGYVERLAERHVTVGTGPGEFSPGEPIAWRHATLWLERVFGSEGSR